MTTRNFAQQIEWLLFTGAIEGNQILTLYEQLQRYIQGTFNVTGSAFLRGVSRARLCRWCFLKISLNSSDFGSSDNG